MHDKEPCPAGHFFHLPAWKAVIWAGGDSGVSFLFTGSGGIFRLRSRLCREATLCPAGEARRRPPTAPRRAEETPCGRDADHGKKCPCSRPARHGQRGNNNVKSVGHNGRRPARRKRILCEESWRKFLDSGGEPVSSTRPKVICCYRFMLMTVSSMVSVVVTPLELAWKPRWVAIICTNSVVMSTLDCSML